VNRALLTLGLVPVGALAVSFAWSSKATPAECTAMLDRYIDMTVAGEPSLAELPETEARAARDTEKAERKSDPRYAHVHEQCEAEVTQREVRCAMKAPSPETWQACID
jgi:hypothetical protein